MMSSLVVFLAISSLIHGKFTGWVDPDTPLSKRTLKSYTDGIEYDLVMSDEFEQSGRSFKDGNDPTWTGIDKADDDQTAQGKKSLQFYNASQITTKGGNLVIKTTTEDTTWRGWNPYKKRYETMKRSFKSGMLQSWDKFCYTGGILEVDVQFPGSHDVGGLWPAVWLLGNLGRATFESSTNLMWPWSYDVCDRKQQHAQEISACGVTNHYSLNAHQGRGATEIDMIEVMAGPSTHLPIVRENLHQPYSSMTLQLAPGIPSKKNRPPSGTLPEWGFTWYHNLTYGANTSINPFFYGTYLAATKKEEPIGRTEKESYQCDAVSAMMQLNESHFQRMHTFRMEWQPGEDGYVHWYGDGEFRFGIEQAGLDPYKTKIPTEPSYVIINTAISTSWGFPSAPIGCTEYDCKTETGRCGFSPGFCKTLPAEFKIAHVRVYQNKNDSNMYVGCNPRSHPTKRYIAAHPEKYTLPGAAHPLKEVVAGGGRCTGHKDCGKTGTCGTFGRCKCSEDFTGPHCLVHAFKNDFPDWDREDWAVFVPPLIPSYLVSTIVVLIVVLVGTIVYAVRRRQQSHSGRSGGYSAIDWRDRASSWLKPHTLGLSREPREQQEIFDTLPVFQDLISRSVCDSLNIVNQRMQNTKSLIAEGNEVIASYFKDLVLNKSMAVPVAAMNALVRRLKDSKASTWMELEEELSSAIKHLKTCSEDDLGGRSHISLESGCELFMKYVTRAFNQEFMDFTSCKEELLRRGEKFAGMSMSARTRIAELGHSFIQDGCTLLVHGVSRVVTGLILRAAESKHFNVVVTESRPDAAGIESACLFAKHGIPTRVVLDAAVGAIMEEVDLCLVGAEGVMENGGIVNKIGTYQIALVAKALQVPFYVAVESYKFARMYPLSQRDVTDLTVVPDLLASVNAPLSASHHTSQGQGHNCIIKPNFSLVIPSPSKLKRSFTDLASSLPANVEVEQQGIDFTPANCITLLFTDIGVLTPAAVSDELIRLYQ